MREHTVQEKGEKGEREREKREVRKSIGDGELNLRLNFVLAPRNEKHSGQSAIAGAKRDGASPLWAMHG